MPEQQLHLFEAARPLLSRFGAEFFRAVPARPGVYIMGGDAECVLYVGQSKNLRHRLGSYKNARPDRAPRKVIRLIHCVRTITWQECASAEAAQVKENELLRTLRPKFNVMNTYPQAYRFIAFQVVDGEMILSLLSEPKSPAQIYGAFKGGVRAFAALLRMLWVARHQPLSPFDFPAPLLNPKPPREYRFCFENGPHPWSNLVENFLAGKSDSLISALLETLPRDENISAFQRNFHACELEILTTFFLRGPKRNRVLRQKHGIDGPIIPQERLDDLLVEPAGN